MSLEAQEKILRDYALNHGFEIVELIIDSAVSAGKAIARRPGGAKLTQLVKDKAVSHVIALKLDRLFRSVKDTLSTVEGWDQAGIALHLVQMGGSSLDTTSPMGRLFLTMTASFAELERSSTSERIKTVKSHCASEGRYLGGAKPIGWTTDGHELVEDTTEQEILSRIATLRQEKMPIRAIAEQFNREGVPARGSKWHPTTIVRLIKDIKARV